MAVRYVAAAVLVLTMLGLLPARAAQRGGVSSEELGPEMTAYLGFIDNEEDELRALYEAGEVSARDFKQTQARLTATRLAATRIARARGDDIVPELHVLRADELTQVLPEGLAGLKGKKAGDRLNDDWLYHGIVRRGEVFYVLERTTRIDRARPF
jgi:hypothetical protein